MADVHETFETHDIFERYIVLSSIHLHTEAVNRVPQQNNTAAGTSNFKHWGNVVFKISTLAFGAIMLDAARNFHLIFFKRAKSSIEPTYSWARNVLFTHHHLYPGFSLNT